MKFFCQQFLFNKITFYLYCIFIFFQRCITFDLNEIEIYILQYFEEFSSIYFKFEIKKDFVYI